MFKKLQTYVVLLGIVALMPGCAMVKSPVMGMWYTHVKAPFVVTDNGVSGKMGTGEAVSILGLIAYGDASVQTIAKKAGITKISHVDEESTNYIGVYARYRVIVYGE